MLYNPPFHLGQGISPKLIDQAYVVYVFNDSLGIKCILYLWAYIYLVFTRSLVTSYLFLRLFIKGYYTDSIFCTLNIFTATLFIQSKQKIDINVSFYWEMISLSISLSNLLYRYMFLELNIFAKFLTLVS